MVLLIFREPQSYTREDVVEMHAHGGRICAQRILRTVLIAGARPAEPGEFTKRAFLNGRIDLLQAEAVADLISAKSEKAASAALAQIEGRLSASMTKIYDGLLTALAHLEAALDFADDDLPDDTMDRIETRMGEIADDVSGLLATWHEGHMLREGALVVISGKPNVGKSTLLNCLLGRDRAIVSETPGTTRDTIEEQLVLDGIPLRLVDTAGLREAFSEVEREGVRRATSLRNNADFNLVVIDSSQELSIADAASIDIMDPSRTMLVLNKIDLGRKTRGTQFPRFSSTETSLLRCEGLESLQKAMLAKLLDHDTPHIVSISERHRVLAESALGELASAVKIMGSEGDADEAVAASHLRSALDAIGEIIGRSYSNELLDNIFRRFCIGK